ncbi:hypothetical protein BG452_31505 [Streptomyces sp. CBMA123]|nr:hypothetical protein [Streptomyces sp. CBMA123]
MARVPWKLGARLVLVVAERPCGRHVVGLVLVVRLVHMVRSADMARLAHVIRSVRCSVTSGPSECQR